MRNRAIARVPAPPEVVSAGLSEVWKGLVGRAIDGDASAQREVLQMSGVRSAVLKRLDSIGDSASPGDTSATPAKPRASLIEQLASRVGADIVPEARALVAELDCGIGEIMRRDRLGLPMSDLERDVAEVAKQVADLRRVEVLDTPSGQVVRLIADDAEAASDTPTA